MLCPGLFTENVVESTRCGTVMVESCRTAKGPFHPRKRNAQKQEGDEVGDNESAAAVGGRLYGESKEVSETYGGPSDSQDNTDLGTPIFSFVLHDSKCNKKLIIPTWNMRTNFLVDPFVRFRRE